EQGDCKQMYALIRKRVDRLQAKEIELCGWQCCEASEIYLDKGFRVSVVFDEVWLLFVERLVFLEYELERGLPPRVAAGVLTVK
ncbi:hypothetical protein AB4M04_25985, partial [Serratia quinivorans]